MTKYKRTVADISLDDKSKGGALLSSTFSCLHATCIHSDVAIKDLPPPPPSPPLSPAGMAGGDNDQRVVGATALLDMAVIEEDDDEIDAARAALVKATRARDKTSLGKSSGGAYNTRKSP